MLHTKKEFENYLTSFLNPLVGHYTKECAGLKIGDTAAWYEIKTVGFEGFSRILWGLVPAWKSNPGFAAEFQAIYQKGLKAGTDPENPEYWGICHDYDQRFVEMAAIAYGILMVPEILWEPFGQKEKENLTAWLNQINEHKLPLCNWEFFRILVNIAMKKCGMDYSEKMLDYSLGCVEDFYIGNGWYQDGDSKQADYYIPWAMHFYGLVYAIVMEKEDSKRCAKFKERAAVFAKDFIYWFSEDGAALPYGRSLTYRFAQCAFFSGLVMADVRPYSLGVMKGIISRNLEYWKKTAMLTSDGLLTIGYGYPNLHMAESYNSPGSPYWAFKSFAFLALPEDHEFWKAEEEPLPILDAKKLLAKAEMIMTRKDGIVTAYTPGNYTNGHAHASSKYGKFAYSTEFGFSTPKSSVELGEAAPDSTLVFELDGYYMPKRKNLNSFIDENVIHCSWSPFQGIIVESEMIPGLDGYHVKHTVSSEMECTAIITGFAVAIEEDRITTETVNEQNRIVASARNDHSFCRVESKTGEAVVIGAAPNTNLIANKTVIPGVRFKIQQGITTIECKITFGR